MAKRDPSEVFSQNASAMREGQTLRVPGGEITYMSISPAFAKDLLEHLHNKQRAVKKWHVTRLANDMLAGNWHMTMDPLRFDKDFNLIDGQHRLLAVVQSGVTIKCLVAMLEDPQAFYAFDQGVIRSLNDIRKTQGKKNYNRTIVGAIMLENADFGDYRGRTKPEQDKTLDEFAMIDDVCALHNAGRGSGGHKASVMNVGTLAVAIRCLRRNRDDALAFFTAVFSMRSTVKGEECGQAHLLYTWLLYSRENHATTGEHFVKEASFKSMRAWNAWRAGERLTKLQYAPGSKVPTARR